MHRWAQFSSRTAILWGAGCLLAAACGTAWWPSSPLAAQDEETLSAFMRKKLVSSSKVLEGLTTEDAELIREGAAALLEMSKAARWNVLLDEDYREFNREFRAAVRKLDEAAEKENFDNATLQWFDAVKACVECHKYVRSQRVATKK
jgi:cytochrome c556